LKRTSRRAKNPRSAEEASPPGKGAPRAKHSATAIVSGRNEAGSGRGSAGSRSRVIADKAVEPDGIPPAVLKELRRVARELKAGKAVAAYERLSAVLDHASAGPER
jgi:hypothetical protein